MEIIWLGHSCFRLRGREATLITDPYDRSLGYALGRLSAQIVTVSHHHPDHDNVASIGGSPKIIDGPGEFEIAGVLISGIPTFHDPQEGKLRGRNTVYLIELDDLTIVHLGDLGHPLSAEQAEELTPVDVLLVPVGGGTTITAEQAAEAVSLLEPKIVIPMHYLVPGLQRELDPATKFLKEMGLDEAAPQPKLTITPASLPPETQVMVLDYRR